MNSQNGNLWVLLFPMLCTAYKPCPPFIHGMVCGMTDNIEACTHQGITEAEVCIEAGISGNSKLRSPDNYLLIHKCQICCRNFILCMCKQRIVVIASIRLSAAFLYRRVQKHIPDHHNPVFRSCSGCLLFGFR